MRRLIVFFLLLAGVARADWSSTPAPLHAADASHDGVLTKDDWATFNGKAPSTRTVSTTAPLTGGGDLSANRTLAMPAATGSVDGYLAHGDWVTFNSKLAAPSFTQGSVVYEGASALSQDNANFFWDGTNHRLGIGTTAPAQSLDVNGSINITGDLTSGVFNLLHMSSNELQLGSSNVNDVTTPNLNVTGTVTLSDKIVARGAETAPGGLPIATFASSALTDRLLATGINNTYSWIQSYLNSTPTYNDIALQPLGGNVGIGTSAPTQRVDVYNGNIRLSNQGSMGGNPGYTEYDDTSGNSIKIQAPATTASHTLVLPTNHPTAVGQVLSATGSSDPFQLSWEDPGITLATFYSHQQQTAGGHSVAAVFCSAADGNVDITGGSPTCDGLSPTGGAAILAGQTDPTQNGLWKINEFGAWTYEETWGDPTGGCVVSDGYILSVSGAGTTYGHTAWQVKCVAGNATFVQIPVSSRSGSCTVASTTLSTTAANLTCAGVPASTAVAVSCSGAAAMSTPTGEAVYCRATGTINQIACNTVVANTTAMAFNCMWMQP